LNHRLNQLNAFDRKIRIGVVGIGSVGQGIALQAKLTPGIECVAIADIERDRAVSWAQRLQSPYRVVNSGAEMNDAIRRNELAVCADSVLVAQCELVDVLIESTNSTLAGGRHGVMALEHEKHVIMMNYEADLLFGAYLMRLAKAKRRIYTVCDGDQPAVLKRLIDEMEFMGFQLVMAGNIKGFLDRYANPTTIIPEAEKRNLDPRMCASYTDGTKLNIEMAVVANGLGLRTLTPGMFGPHMNDVLEVFDHFDFANLWDSNQAFVDYVLGARPKGGVFAIGYTADKHQQETLNWFPSEMGPGPFYMFARPYHLSHFESMQSVVSAVLDGQPVLQPEYGFQTNVYAYAKRDLKKGETLDDVGGYTCYGLIENCADNLGRPALPICLAIGTVLKTDVGRDKKIYLDMVRYSEQRPDFALFAQASALSRDLQP
jgi:predicted homoserine dehydrogenase-like protein